jgi:flagellin
MTVSTIATIAAGLSRPASSTTTVRAAEVLGGLFQQAAARPTGGDAVAGFAAATNQLAPLRVASQNIAQAASLLEVAQRGSSAIARTLGDMASLTARAAMPEVSAQERIALNTQFQQGREEIDRIARETRFNNAPLLDGTTTELTLQSTASARRDFSVGAMTSGVLFKGVAVDVLSPSGAKIAATTVRAATEYVAAQLTNLADLQTGVEFAAATVASAVQNQEAARARVDPADFEALVSQSASEARPESAAQTNRLPTSLLQLLGE